MAEPKPYLQVKIPEGYQRYTGGVANISIPIFRLNPETNSAAAIRANEHAEAKSKLMAFGLPAAMASSIADAGIDTTNAGSARGLSHRHEAGSVARYEELLEDTTRAAQPGIPFGQVGDENAPLYRTADNLGRITEESAVMGGLAIDPTDRTQRLQWGQTDEAGQWSPMGSAGDPDLINYADLSQGYAGLYGTFPGGTEGSAAYPGLAESVEKREADKKLAADVLEKSKSDWAKNKPEFQESYFKVLDGAVGVIGNVYNLPSMTTAEIAAAHAKGELTTFDEVLNDWSEDDRMIQPLDAAGNPMGEPFINPVLALALTYATNQAGFISDVQVANATAEGNLEIAKQQGINQQAVAFAQNRSDNYRANIKANTDLTIATLQSGVDQARFELEQNLATLNHEAKMLQGTEQHGQIMEQLGLNRAQLTEEYKVRSEQIASQRLQESEQHLAQMAKIDLQREQDAEQAQLERDARKAASDLASADIERQMERDRITAETNQKIEEIRRLSAGDVAAIDKQIAQRRSEEAEALAGIEQQTILGTGAQQLQATLAGTEADIQIATTQAEAQKEAQLAIQALQDSAAIDELTKAKEVATLYANAEKEAQIAIQTLRETTILGDLEKAKAIATLQQAMQITAQTATAALQVNQGISDVERAKAVATIQENTRASTDLAIAELQANTKITELEKTNILATMQAGATTQAATTQAGAVTGAAALQAEAAGPFGYVGAGEDAADRAQRLTDAQTILGAEFNPYGLSNAQFTGMQDVAAQAGATPFGALATAPDARYQDILGVQQAQAAAGPFQAAQLGQGMGDISTILRGGNTPEQQLALAQAPGNPFGLTANEQMALQNSLARGGLTPTQRLAEVQAGSAPQNMANYLNFIGNPAAVGFAGQSGFLQNMADSPEGNLPASLFGLNVPQAAPTVPTNPTMADLSGLTDEQLGFYQGQQAAQNYQTPSQIFQQAQTVTPQGV